MNLSERMWRGLRVLPDMNDVHAMMCMRCRCDARLCSPLLMSRCDVRLPPSGAEVLCYRRWTIPLKFAH